MLALVPDSNRFRVIKQESYATQEGAEHIVPVGYVSDLTSIPRPLWGFLPPHHFRYRMAALFHDWLLEEGFPRKYADNVFKEIMQYTGNNKIRTSIMYGAVRFWSFLKSIWSSK